MSIRANRNSHELSGKKLRRARHLFIFFRRNNIKTTQQLKDSAEIMRDSGLYAQSTGLKDVRFHILRNLWRLEGGKYGTWHRWLDKNGWMVGSWSNHWVLDEKEPEQKSVASRQVVDW